MQAGERGGRAEAGAWWEEGYLSQAYNANPNSSNPRALEDACIHGPIVTPAGQFPNNSLGGEEMAQPPVPCSGDNYTALAS